MIRLLIVLCLWALPVFAVQPDEVLSDPALEHRAREISQGLRCLVCRNENIDDSNADLARDLRVLVRERLTAGDSDQEVVGYIVDRYGEYVLLKPRANGANILLWAAGPLMLIIGALIAFLYFHRQSPQDEPAVEALSEEERVRLDNILTR